MDDYRQHQQQYQQQQQQQQQHYGYQAEPSQGGPRLDNTHGRYSGHAQYNPHGSSANYAWNGYSAANANSNSNSSMHMPPAAQQPHLPVEISAAATVAPTQLPRTTAHKGKSPAAGGTQPLRIKISERLQQIDREAFETEERRYQQKGEEIHSEVGQILRGTHPSFVEGIARLAAERDRSVQGAEQNHRYLVDLYTRAYREERAQAEKAYAEERQMVYDKVAADIDERRRRLKEEKDSLDISMDFVFEPGSRTSSKRNLRRRGMDSLLGFGDAAGGAGGGAGMAGGSGSGGGGGGGRSQSKRKKDQALTMQGIAESDIVSDLTAIRLATGVTGPLSTTAYGKKSSKAGKR
ncbi:hypothetical protein LPJ53_002785 [Coemansia erecta]|uniref:Sds3-like-domain-containing protein n=1 Tax=Coemansia erecta TaxID=147472 RepID=A0A9W8CSN2_9FUNG|nr:hypothetical protein LPJ53_002785 [Coemansia erecta]